MTNIDSRRDFLRKTMFSTVGLATGLSAKSYSNIIGSNDRIRLGVLGLDNVEKVMRTFAHIESLRDLNVELIAISGVSKKIGNTGDKPLDFSPLSNIRETSSNEELLDKGDIDAVIICSDIFDNTCLAINSKVDVYIDEPFLMTFNEAKILLEIVEKSKQILQLATWRRSCPNYTATFEYIQSGKFGALNTVELDKTLNPPKLPNITEALIEDKKNNDWARYLSSNSNELSNLKSDIKVTCRPPYTSDILFIEFMNQIDTVHWLSGNACPTSVVAKGGVFRNNIGGLVPDSVHATLDYAPVDSQSNRLKVIYSAKIINADQEPGADSGAKEIYHSNAGELDIHSNTVNGGKSKKTCDSTSETNGSLKHMINWIGSLRSRKQPNSPIRTGYNQAIALQMTLRALYTGKQVTFDSNKQEILVNQI